MRWVPILLVSMMISLAFSACSSARPLEFRASAPAIPHPMERPPVPNPEPITTLPVPVAGMCLTPAAAENLLRSLADANRWVAECRARLDYYGQR